MDLQGGQLGRRQAAERRARWTSQPQPDRSRRLLLDRLYAGQGGQLDRIGDIATERRRHLSHPQPPQLRQTGDLHQPAGPQNAHTVADRLDLGQVMELRNTA